MEAIKKQAARLREQVAKQQQAVLKHLGHFGNEAVIVDEAEFQCYQELQNLYKSTRAAKHFQKHIIRGIEGLLSASSKQMEIARKLAEDCCKYGADTETTNLHVARAALQFGTSHNLMENERETLHGVLGDQVSEPLRAMVTGAPLEDARHLTHRYEKIRQEVEAQGAEVLRRRSKTRESDISAENCAKLRSAEARLKELKSTMTALGKEATAAMLSVENQQQQITVQRLFMMVDAERCYHQHVLAILDKLQAEMMLEEQLIDSSTKLNDSSPESMAIHQDSSSQSMTIHQNSLPQSMAIHQDSKSLLLPTHQDATSNGATSNGTNEKMHDQNDQKDSFFIAKFVHPFDAQAEGELSLSLGDFVVVRQVAPTGWSEGECNGKAGWFPSAYIEKQEKAPVDKITEEDQVHSS